MAKFIDGQTFPLDANPEESGPIDGNRLGQEGSNDAGHLRGGDGGGMQGEGGLDIVLPPDLYASTSELRLSPASSPRRAEDGHTEGQGGIRSVEQEPGGIGTGAMPQAGDAIQQQTEERRESGGIVHVAALPALPPTAAPAKAERKSPTEDRCEGKKGGRTEAEKKVAAKLLETDKSADVWRRSGAPGPSDGPWWMEEEGRASEAAVGRSRGAAAKGGGGGGDAEWQEGERSVVDGKAPAVGLAGGASGRGEALVEAGEPVRFLEGKGKGRNRCSVGDVVVEVEARAGGGQERVQAVRQAGSEEAPEGPPFADQSQADRSDVEAEMPLPQVQEPAGEPNARHRA
jgi:hypothetical protein